MRLFAIIILYKDGDSAVRFLQSCQDLTTFGYFEKRSASEFMDFTAKLVVERTQRCLRSSVKEKEYLCHVYVRPDNLAGVLLSDQEYPQRVGQTLLTKREWAHIMNHSILTKKLLEEFSKEYPDHEWPRLPEKSANFKATKEYLDRYQNPREADSMMKLQTDLDETKIILHNTLEALLERGEKIDDLVLRSEGLSMQAKTFYQTAKKTNRCCTIL